MTTGTADVTDFSGSLLIASDNLLSIGLTRSVDNDGPQMTRIEWIFADFLRVVVGCADNISRSSEYQRYEVWLSAQHSMKSDNLLSLRLTQRVDEVGRRRAGEFPRI